MILTVETQRQKPVAGSFERATQGALFTREGFSVSWALRYDNMVNGGLNCIKLGDGRALTVINKDGSKIYQYLNFDQIEEYAEAAKAVA